MERIEKDIFEATSICPGWKPLDPWGTPPKSVEAIDLGLPSYTKWATINVGATRPEESGGLYAWGETNERIDCDWDSYSHCGGDMNTCYDLGRDISGSEFDVAHVKWGGRWKIPTCKQIEELRDNCSYEWATLNGVEGGKFIGPNGNSIFLPFSPQQNIGQYWSSEPDYRFSAFCFSIGRKDVYCYTRWVEVHFGRCTLMYIRPVYCL